VIQPFDKLYVQLDDVLVVEDMVPINPQAVDRPILAPNAGEIELFGEILVHGPGHIEDGAALPQGERGIELSLLPGDLAVGPDDVEEGVFASRRVGSIRKYSGGRFAGRNSPDHPRL
jgi:hypothetical protein